MKSETIVATIATVILLLAIPEDLWPYAYYQFLRWAVTGSAIYLAFKAAEFEKTKWAWTMGIVAILFNPIFPFYLEKEVWVIIDAMTAGIFVGSIFFIKEKS